MRYKRQYYRKCDYSDFCPFWSRARCKCYEDAFDETAKCGLVENEILPFVDIEINAADDLQQTLEFQDTKSFGDYWNNYFKSTRNSLLKPKSLKALRDFMQVGDSDICFFLHLVLMMHDSFSNYFLWIRNLQENQILEPFWQNCNGGLNDRFAFSSQHALEFCQCAAGPLRSEQFLLYSIMRYGLRTKELNVTTSHIHVDGMIAQEDNARRRFRTWYQWRRLIKKWNFSNSQD